MDQPTDRDPIIRGIATILWASTWADHVAEVRCRSLSGCEITQVMPSIDEAAFRLAHRVAGRIEQVNYNLPSLCAAAWRADGNSDTDDSPDDEFAERFGECLAYMAQGAGVSWFDDHKEFPLEVPLCLHGGDLLSEVADACPHCAPCDECGNHIPIVNGGELANRHHAESCSLYDADEE